MDTKEFVLRYDHTIVGVFVELIVCFTFFYEIVYRVDINPIIKYFEVFCSLIVIISYFMCITTEPGHQFKSTLRQLKKTSCKTCKIDRPKYVHHCKVCQQCVLMMDHHCVWIGRCVGYFNYKFFIIFVNFAAL